MIICQYLRYNKPSNKKYNKKIQQIVQQCIDDTGLVPDDIDEYIFVDESYNFIEYTYYFGVDQISLITPIANSIKHTIEEKLFYDIFTPDNEFVPDTQDNSSMLDFIIDVILPDVN